MDKSEIRAVIKFLHMEGRSATEIKTRLDAVLDNTGPSFSTVSFWVSEFRRGRTHTKDEPRSGRPKTATSSNIVQKIQKLVLEDRRIKVREIAEIADISYERVVHILHDELDMKKLFASWVPCILSVEQKQSRLQTAANILNRFQANTTELLGQFITVGDICLRPFQGTRFIKSPAKKVRKESTAEKLRVYIFWDAQGVLLVDYMEVTQSSTESYYIELLAKLEKAIEMQRPELITKKVLFYLDDGNLLAVLPKHFDKLNFELLPHATLSPDLAPSNFQVLPKLKNSVAAKKCTSHDELKAAVKDHFDSQSEKHFHEGVEQLIRHCNICVETDGNYIDK